MPKINVHGLNMYYEFEGMGTPMVLISGLGGDHLTWAAQVPAFAAEGFRCLIFDNRDVGQTDESPSLFYDVPQVADDTIGLMDQLGLRSAHILGASMGGAIAQEIVANYPNRVLSLTLVSTFPAVDAYGSLVINSWKLLRPQMALEDFCYVISPWLFTNRFLNQPEAVQAFLQMARDNPFPQTVGLRRSLPDRAGIGAAKGIAGDRVLRLGAR